MSLSNIKDFAETILNELGPGYKEHIYVNAMCIHLRDNETKYQFHNEVIVPIIYKGMQLGYERADIVIYEPDKCIIEFKSQTQSIGKKEIMQLSKYMKNLQINNGILINFGNLNGTLEYKALNNTRNESNESNERDEKIIIDCN